MGIGTKPKGVWEYDKLRIKLKMKEVEKVTEKCYKDFEGNVLLAEEVNFTEEADEEYVNDWNLNQFEFYQNILKENTYIYNQIIKEYK